GWSSCGSSSSGTTCTGRSRRPSRRPDGSPPRRRRPVLPRLAAPVAVTTVAGSPRAVPTTSGNGTGETPVEEQGQPGDVPGRRARRTPRADRRLRLRGVVAPAVAALVLAACTGDDTSPDRGTAVPTDDLTDVTVGVLPVLPTAAVQLGIDEGIFASHGFRVSLETAQGGADLLPRVTDGELKFALSNPLSVMQAQAADRDVRVVTGFSHALATGEDITSVWAQQEADIDGPADLEGATVAVNTRHTMGELSINAVVAGAGGDPRAIEYVGMGFPDMPAALERGDVDAAWAPEPYQTVLRTTGAALVTCNYQETLPGVPTLVVVTSGALADADAGLV